MILRGRGWSFSWWQWLLWGLFFVVAVVIGLHPLASQATTHYLGCPGADLYDEVWLQQAVLHGIPLGQLFANNAMNFPFGVNLLATHLSFLHIAFTALWAWLLPWPLWWNVCVTLALASAGLAAFWSVGRVVALAAENSSRDELGKGTLFLGLAAGLACALGPWMLRETGLGHLNQLWTAPLFLSFAYLYEVVYAEWPGSPERSGAEEGQDDEEERQHFSGLSRSRAWLWLGFWTIITFAVYWMYGIFLALSGALMLLAHFRFMTTGNWKRVGRAVLLALVVLAPLAWQVIKSQPLVQTSLHTQVASEVRTQVIERALNYSVSLAPSWVLQDTPPVSPVVGAVLLPWLGILLPCLVLFLEVRSRGQGLFIWLVLALIFFVLSLGPYFVYGGKIMGNGAGEAVLMPYMLLLDAFPVLYRWSLPARTVPLSVFLLCAFCVSLYARTGERATITVLRWFSGALLLLFMLVFTRINSVYPGISRELTPAYSPPFCDRLAELPRGGVLDLPLGFMGNIQQVQCLHHQPVLQNHAPVPDVALKYAVLQYMWRWNDEARARAIGWDRPPQQWGSPYKGVKSQTPSLPYGTHALPEGLEVVEVMPESQAKKLDAEHLRNDYRFVWDLGARYLVVHRANCYWVDGAHGNQVYTYLVRQATDLLGKPYYCGYDATIFILPQQLKLE